MELEQIGLIWVKFQCFKPLLWQSLIAGAWALHSLFASSVPTLISRTRSHIWPRLDAPKCMKSTGDNPGQRRIWDRAERISPQHKDESDLPPYNSKLGISCCSPVHLWCDTGPLISGYTLHVGKGKEELLGKTWNQLSKRTGQRQSNVKHFPTSLKGLDWF